MPKLSMNQKSFLRLLKRSKDVGDGWRVVSEMLRHLAKTRAEELPELLEFDEEASRIRFTEEGAYVTKWLGS